MEPQKFKFLLWAPAMMALSLILGLSILGKYIAARRSENIITVTGSVKEKITSDHAKWSGTVSRQTPIDGVKTGTARVLADTEKVKKFIKDKGFDEKLIKVAPLQINPAYNYDNGNNTLNGYMVSVRVEVESDDVLKIEALSQATFTILEQDIVLEYPNTEYYYSNLAEMRPGLFAKATKDARERANAIAEATGVRVGKARSARTGVIQILPPNSQDIADWGSYDLSTREKEISATTTVSFELK